MKMQQQQAALIKHGFIYKRTNKGTGLHCAEALDKAGGVSHGFSTREGGTTLRYSLKARALIMTIWRW